MSENKPKAKNWFSKHPLITLILIMFILGNIVSSIMSKNLNTNEEQTTIKENLSPEEQYLNKNRGVAKMMCRNSIKLQLKSPSTASFDDQNVQYTGIKGKEGLVTGIIKSQNSFGAIVENRYACYLGYINGDYQIVETKILK